MDRIKISEVKGLRETITKDQGGTCAICDKSLKGKIANLDHDHKTGIIRGVLCRPCNTLLGKIENFLNSYGHPDAEEFMCYVWKYISSHKDHPSNVYHYTYKTEEEKRLARNAKARKARKAKATKGVKK